MNIPLPLIDRHGPLAAYNHMREKYYSTKPIRGRSADIRPIDKRRKDTETIEQKLIGVVDGQNVYSYAAKLHRTECVEYLPDGNIILRNGGWITPSTIKFISAHSPFTCWVERGTMWIRSGVYSDHKYYPLLGNLELKPSHAQAGFMVYVPVDPDYVIQVKIVDRTKAKIARRPLEPFLSWMRTFLEMTGGKIVPDTYEEQLDIFSEAASSAHKDSPLAGDFKIRWVSSFKDWYKFYIPRKDDHDLYLPALCKLMDIWSDILDYETSGGKIIRHVRFEKFYKRINALVVVAADCYKIQERYPSNKTFAHVVP